MHSLRTRLLVVVLLALGAITASPALGAGSLPAPSRVSVTPGHDSAAITWKYSKGATSYTVCLLTNGHTSTCSHTKRALPPHATFTHLTPTGGTDWFVQVTAHNADGSATSKKVGFNLRPDPNKPATPTNVKVTPSGDSAEITWRWSRRATSYAICLTHNGNTGTCQYIKTALPPRATFTHLKPTGGRDWFVQIRAINKYGSTSSSIVGFDLVRPPAPRSVKVTPTHNSVSVKWRWSPGATSYTVCLLSNGSTSTCSHSKRALPPRATLTGLKPTGGTDWFVQVRANNAMGSSYSTKVPVNLLPTPSKPSAPTNVAVAATEDTAAITWRWAKGATSYTVCLLEEANSSTCTHTKTAYPTRSTISGLKPTDGTDWFVRIRANNDTGYTDAPVLGFNLTPGPRPAEGTDVSVMTMNLCGQDKCGNLDPWSTRKSTAGALARMGRADIIATQESSSIDTKFETELPGYAVAEVKSAKALFYDTSRFDVLNSGNVTLNPTTKKYAVWAEFLDRDTNTRFIVTDAHLQQSKGKTNDDERFRQTNILLAEVARQNPDDLPVVHAGDFNSNADNANTSKYKGGYDAPRKAFAAAGIVDAIDTAVVSYNTSWNSANQATNPPKLHGHHVDHVYLDPEIIVNEWRILLRLTRVDGKLLYTEPFATDHNPVVARLTIPGE